MNYSHRSLPENISTSPNMIREDIKRLKLIEIQLNDEVKALAHQRDGLVMELQQLQEAKPVLERAYAVIITSISWNLNILIKMIFFFFYLLKFSLLCHSQRTPHPSLIQRIQQLEQKNRHLQFCLKQQQQYTETIMQRKYLILFEEKPNESKKKNQNGTNPKRSYFYLKTFLLLFFY